MNQTEFLRVFGDAIRRKRAAVFVGAGVSRNSGFPNWEDLIAPLKAAAKVPSTVTDETLAAEYALQELKRDQVEQLLLESLRGVTPTPNEMLDELLSIDFAEIWTTNFDTLIEDASEDLDLVIKDADYETTASKPRRLTKLHGSLGKGPDGSMAWHEHPVITRSHFESFEREHPLKWAMLRAQFLTSSFLFLGFSFADPNVGALLRIVRSLPLAIRRMPHFAVMKSPTEEDKQREFELFRRDMHAAGVYIIEVSDYAKIPELLRGLARNALPPNLFISGSVDGDESMSVCAAIGAGLDGLTDGLTLMSFDGKAAREVARAYKMVLEPDSYRPEHIRVFYRRSPDDESETIVQRFGTAVFTEKSLDDMRLEIFSQVRALVLVGSGERSLAEAELAREKNIPVVPVASSGTTAQAMWQRGREACGFADESADHAWALLSNSEPSFAARGVKGLLDTVMNSGELASS